MESVPASAFRLFGVPPSRIQTTSCAEKTFGPAAARRVYAYQLDRYLRRRAAVSRDVPLLDVTDQAYIMYGKGAIVMYMLREQIGEERVNTALRRLLEKHCAGVPPYPTSSDLYAELRAVTPHSLQSLLVDLFETITLWDVRSLIPSSCCLSVLSRDLGQPRCPRCRSVSSPGIVKQAVAVPSACTTRSRAAGM